MVLDFASQESLEIFMTSNEEEKDNEKQSFNCLADMIDNTTTPFGRRLLRKWLGSPLIDTDQITIRQEAIQDLLDNFTVVKQFKQHMIKVKDLERMLARVYTYSVQSQM